MKNLYIVRAELELPVYADNYKDAKEIARDNVLDARWYDYSYTVNKITNLKFIDADSADSIPYGNVDEDNLTDLSVKEIFELKTKEIK